MSPQEVIDKIDQKFTPLQAQHIKIFLKYFPDSYDTAVSYWKFTHQYTTNQTKVHIYNPQWHDSHTIISILIKDMPFLVDSIRMALNRLKVTIHLIIDPVLSVQRDSQGYLRSYTQAGTQESIIHIEIEKQTEPTVLKNISQELEYVLKDLRQAVDDWQAMSEKMAEILDTLKNTSTEEVSEICDFLHWAQNNHFTFLGYQHDQEPGLGILRHAQNFESFIAHSKSLVLTKTNTHSTIHRPVRMDYIGITSHEFPGEHRFIGLFTSAAYHQLAIETPMIRHKIKYVFEKTGFWHSTHKDQAMLYILETYPRDELFQIEPEHLRQTVNSILKLNHQAIRLFVRADTFHRFFSCLVYISRDSYNTDCRQRMEKVLRAAFGGQHIEFNVQLSESIWAQIHFIVYTPTDVQYDIKNIEDKLIEVTRVWTDVLHHTLIQHHGEQVGNRLFLHYKNAFPVAYKEDFSALDALSDIDKIEHIIQHDGLALDLYDSCRFKIFLPKNHLSLSEVLPMLENMGVKVLSERAYEVNPVWIQDFGLEHDEKSLDFRAIKTVFQDVFERVWRGDIENDGFNRLALRAKMTWREIIIFRAYWKYLRQTNASFSQVYVEHALINNHHITVNLLKLFYARCKFSQNTEHLEHEISQSLDAIESLDEDRILRLFFNTILATLRTNYFQNKAYLSFKLDPSKVPDLPEPRPMFEIFVYSPSVEGVHLRGGKVARGGLRWSDRLEDFRTEILGLVKAQRVKNAVIVPVGSKGGFVVKRGTGIECYKIFIRGLLDLTDNIIEGTIVPPDNVVRYDTDDPYLVVAADKGTATFSDIANDIAKEYHFWLGDAFASGGSSGYDHKKMAITARGAWESVKQHFRDFGVNTQTQDFTVIGIGDMSGDVFGNGMLLSPHIQLVGAFNHQHIFLDPTPKNGLQERQRLFNLPRSTWADYNPELISTGGGVFSRRSKMITLSAQIQTLLNIQAKTVSSNTLIQAMLCAPVDLLWNGGIGTYVKAETEHHTDVGDKSNDALRVNGKDLRCKVVGEGGNLGFTQLGRIEYALKGGRIYTDAIDNSGGVDCSDHEVNIKILLNKMTHRNDLLVEMTESVANLVLKNNYVQIQSLKIPLALSPQMLDVHTRFLRYLEKQGHIERHLEFLPNNKTLAERRAAQQGLTSPELCVLLSYSKITLYQALLESDLVDKPYFKTILADYFPDPLPKRFDKEIASHRLHREIIATQISNLVVNRGGIVFVYMLEEETGQKISDIVSAFLVSCEIFEIHKICVEIETLDNKISADVQTQLMMSTRQHIERTARWLLCHHQMPLEISQTIHDFHPGVMRLVNSLLSLMDQAERDSLEQSVQDLVTSGVPLALAHRIAHLEIWLSALNIVKVSNTVDIALENVATVHFLLATRLKLHWLRQKIGDLARDNRWTALSRSTLRDELSRTHRKLTTLVLQTEGDVDMWMLKNKRQVDRYQQVLSDISHVEKPYLAMLSVALREIQNLL